MRRILFFAAIGFSLSALLIYFFGDSGLSSYRSLDEYRGRLAANVEELGALNAKLSGELEYLKSSPSAVKTMAGGLGLYGKDDYVIRLEDPAARRVSYDAGKLLRLPKRKEVKSYSFKIMGAGLALFLAFGAFLLHGIARKKAARDHLRR